MLDSSVGYGHQLAECHDDRGTAEQVYQASSRLITRLPSEVDETFVFFRRIDIGKGTFVLDLHIAGGRHVRANDRLHTASRVGGADLIEQGAIDQDGMPVQCATHGPNDGRMR
jgi:hypothetical protein